MWPARESLRYVHRVRVPSTAANLELSPRPTARERTSTREPRASCASWHNNSSQMMAQSHDHPRPIRVGISACLLGEEVRYDGGHKRDAVIIDTLGGLVEWVPVCPEVEAGFGTPREPMNLVRTEGGVRVITVDTARDLTES